MIILCEDLNWQLSSSRALAFYLTPLQVVTVETFYSWWTKKVSHDIYSHSPRKRQFFCPPRVHPRLAIFRVAARFSRPRRHREHTMARTFTLIYLFEESLPIRAIFSVYRTRPAKSRGRVNDSCWQVLPTLQNIFLEAIQLSEP